jgi:hypothetical protein
MKRLTALLLLVLAVPAFAQSVEVNDSGESNAPIQAAPGTGRQQATKYFQARKNEGAPGSVDTGATPHLLALHFGGFFQGQSYQWGDNEKQGAGRFNGGVTYRVGEWVNSMDLSIRAEYTSYWFNEDQYARKISFSPIITFPDANSRFPLYFGAGTGLGLFMHQLKDESPVSFDWQVFGGVRFLNVFESVGFMVEAGLKNQILLFSDGQFNGVFVNVGSVFAF